MLDLEGVEEEGEVLPEVGDEVSVGGFEASPCPRCVGAIARIDSGSSGSTGSNDRQESAYAWRSTTGEPSAAPVSTYGSSMPFGRRARRSCSVTAAPSARP